MKIVVIGDRPIPADALAEAVNSLDTNEEKKIIKLTWGSSERAKLQAQQLNVEKNGPEAEPIAEGLKEEIEDADVVISHLAVIPAEIINRAKKLKLIGTCRGGVEQIDVAAATAKRIPVIHVIRNAEAVSEFTIGLMICESRNIARAHMSIASGGWTKDFANSKYVMTIRNQTLGIVGLGHIGRLTATKARALGMKVIGYDPYVTQGFLRDEGLDIEKHEVDDVFKMSDFVSLHLKATKETEGMVDGRLIGLMKPTAYLINTSRASVVNKEALYSALKGHHIGGAALDVYWDEPLPSDDPLRTLDDVTLTSHLAGTSVDSIPHSPYLLVDTINDFWRRGKSSMQVNHF